MLFYFISFLTHLTVTLPFTALPPPAPPGTHPLQTLGRQQLRALLRYCPTIDTLTQMLTAQVNVQASMNRPGIYTGAA